MATSRIVKLAAGESLSLMVESAELVEGAYGKQLQLLGQNFENENVTIFLGLDTANRQLERIGLTQSALVGEVLKIEKVQKGTQTFININRTAGNPTNGRGKAVQLPPPDPTPDWLRDQDAAEDAVVKSAQTVDGVARFFTHYDKCFAHAVELSRRVKGPDTVVTLEGISAIAATLYIATKSAI